MEKVLYGKWTIEEGDRWELKGREIKNTEHKHKTADSDKEFTNLTKFRVFCRDVWIKMQPLTMKWPF